MALHYGADAVYLAGTQFGMRAAAGNFTFPELKLATELAHANGTAVHMTCNTLPREDELSQLPEFRAQAQDAGVDAFMIADLGVMAAAEKYAPKVSRHVSTQLGVINSATANVLFDMGADRVVLARETPMEDIRKIRANTPKELEIEAFVHGAMCVSFSGRCLLSNYLTGRDANRGACAQPCRWKYHLVEEKRPGEYFEISEDNGTHIMNSRDMCMIEHIPELLEAGVSSFQIEGRMKSPYYVATVVNAYRRAIDAYYARPDDYETDERIAADLFKTTHRQFTEGFTFYDGEVMQNYETSRATGDSEFLAVVKDYSDGVATVEMRSRFKEGQRVEILSPSDAFGRKVEIKNLRDVNDLSVDDAKRVQQILKFDCPYRLLPNDILRTE